MAGKITLVAGATRGAGRGIATMLGEAGAVVYCTGRSSRSRPGEANPVAVPGSPFALAGRPETIEETADLVNAHGGQGIAVRVDHTVPGDVQSLMERIKQDHGRLDVLVNDVWGGDELAQWGTPFWELDSERGWLMQERAVLSHIITARFGAPLLIAAEGGLLVEITDGDTDRYRGNLFYDLAKHSAIRLARAMSEELRPHNVSCVALTPGFLRSEAMLEYFGVAKENWQEGAVKDPHFRYSESPHFVGRAVAALAADRSVMEKTGRALSSWGLAREYGFRDTDGTVPDWGRHFAEAFGESQ